jgi:hypothetical protein
MSGTYSNAPCTEEAQEDREGVIPQGKISGMWYYPPLSLTCLESFGEDSITFRKSYPGITPSRFPYEGYKKFPLQ